MIVQSRHTAVMRSTHRRPKGIGEIGRRESAGAGAAQLGAGQRKDRFSRSPSAGAPPEHHVLLWPLE